MTQQIQPDILSLSALLRPRSVAVIGASEDRASFSGAPLFNLQQYGFAGSIYPINPRRREVQGLRCYPTILDVPESVDAAVIVVPADSVLEVLEQCERGGVRSATVVSAGFGEEAAGESGRKRAGELDRFVRNSRMRILGPNTTGVVNVLDGYVPRAAVNHVDPNDVRKGPVALISQSGACGNVVFNRAQVNGLGIAYSVATGDQADVDVWDLVGYAIADERVRAVMLIVEALDRIHKIEQAAASALAAEKPLIVLRLGKSRIGQGVVLAHSGSLAGNSQVGRAALQQLGMLEVDDFDQLWEVARLFEAWGPPSPDAGRVGVYAYSGGEAALIADYCERYGIGLAPVTAEFSRFVAHTFSYARPANPFDTSGEVISRAEKADASLRAFVTQNGFTEVLVAVPVFRRELAERLLSGVAAALQGTSARVMMSAWTAGALTEPQLSLMRATGLPVLETSTRAIRALARYTECGRRRCAGESGANGGGTGPVAQDLGRSARYFTVRACLANLGLAFSDARLVHCEDDAVASATALGYPVVMKANVPSEVHKSAHKLVLVGLKNAEAVRQGYGRLVAAAGAMADGVVVEEMVSGELQVLLGSHRDPEFGPVVVFGSGGTSVDYLEDSELRVARYLDASGAIELIRATRVGRFLATRAPALMERLASAIGRLGALMQANAQVDGVDLNPCIISLGNESVVCVDARVIQAVGQTTDALTEEL